MIGLLSKDGMADLRNFVTTDTLLAFDLDGTLAPIVAEPSEIRVSDDVQSMMNRLSALTVTAVITGRSRADALAHIGFQPHYLVGNHGAEGLPGFSPEDSHFAGMVTGWEKQLAALLDQRMLASVFFESKGSTLSLHYRHASDPQAVRNELLAVIARLTPVPRRIGGKFVENLIPQGAPHKGDALLHLLESTGCGKALFVGDDETDEDVFRLDDMRLFTISVGLERPTAARYLLERQEDMRLLLGELLACFASGG